MPEATEALYVNWGTDDPSVGIFGASLTIPVGYELDAEHREEIRAATVALFRLLSDDERAVGAVFSDEIPSEEDEEWRSRVG